MQQPLTHNSKVADDLTNGPSRAADPDEPPVSAQAPLPIPDLLVADEASAFLASFHFPEEASPTPSRSEAAATLPPVSDADRNRYGLLLDRAAERGLLSSFEYELRLGDLASATSIEQMNRIVTELPVFNPAAVPRSPAKSRRRASSTPSVDLSVGRLPDQASQKPRVNRWLLLAVVVMVVVGSMLLLALYAQHLVHSRHSGMSRLIVTTSSLSVLRL